MKLHFFVGILALIFFPIDELQAQKSDEVIGLYWSPKKDAKIKIFKKEGKFFGQFTWLKTPTKDVHNPQKNLRERDLKGMIFLTNFVFESGKYKNGEVYDPESGSTYSCEMWMEQGNLFVKGYVGFSFLGRTEVFEKVGS